MRSRQGRSFVLALVLLAIFVGMFTVVTRADAKAPTLYCNDEVWYKADVYPLLNYNSVYVPISIFEQFPGVSITMYERTNTALISRSEEQYISFDFNRDAAMTPFNERFHLKTYLENGERYVPLVTTCVSLGFKHETYTSTVDGSISARICDGTQTKTFPELLRRYNPGALEPVTAETTPPPVTTPIDPLKNAIFVTVSGLGDGHLLEAMLSLLEENGISATFFLTEQEYRTMPDEVISILAGGHMLGIEVPADGALDALARINAYLADRWFTTTRLMRLSDGTPDHVSDAELAAAGYVRWGTHFDLGRTETEVRTALSAFRRQLATEGRIVLTVRLDGYHPVSYLREFIDSTKGSRAFLPITPAYYAQAE